MSLSHVVLSCGRSVELSQLRMRSTYGGLLEGYPCKPGNEMQIKGLLASARQAFPGAPVHLVPPVRTYPDGASGGAFGPVEVLPAVACVGTFGSYPVDAELNPVLHRSSLTVVWFQDTPDVPTGETAHPSLRDLDWTGLAQDQEL
ncbi:hypothetical protein AB0F18_17525 [Streptomyces sp. NPDC029216]|uniref:hypothetical protein n=1 Tax=Streptomyces sp. NPDC029216 TaxID=3154701 RepID=UPI0033D00398